MNNRNHRPDSFLSSEEKDLVERAIAAAEKETSGEIRVIISRKVKGDPMKTALAAFSRLKMHKTRERNAVLIFLAVASRNFVIIGDEGIHRHMGQEGWDGVRDFMAGRFRQDDFAGGLALGVEKVAEVLKKHFPWRPDDKNELSDELVVE